MRSAFLPEPEDGLVVLYVLAISSDQLSTKDEIRLQSVCDGSEQARAARFVFERDRRLYLSAHGLLRWGLSRCEPAIGPAEWSFRRGRYGRPYIVEANDQGLQFNITHCPERVVCVICRNLQCGVDVERSNRVTDHELLASSVLTITEQVWLKAMPMDRQPECFLRFWTMKEAIAKATGLGLYLPLDQLELDLSQHRPVFINGPPSCVPPWWLWQRSSAGGHIEALAVRLDRARDVLLRYVDIAVDGNDEFHPW